MSTIARPAAEITKRVIVPGIGGLLGAAAAEPRMNAYRVVRLDPPGWYGASELDAAGSQERPPVSVARAEAA